MVALFYDWWNIFVRLAEPDWHREAITSRPLLLHAIAERVRHARQTTIRIASMHARSVPAAEALRAVAKFLRVLAWLKLRSSYAPLPSMAGNPLASLPGLPQRAVPCRAPLRLKPGDVQPGSEAARSRKLNSAPTAAFRLILHPWSVGSGPGGHVLGPLFFWRPVGATLPKPPSFSARRGRFAEGRRCGVFPLG